MEKDKRTDTMKFNEIRKMAKGMQINTYRMKKTEIIRAIQKTENNIECYGTERRMDCNEDKCLWKDDGLSFNETIKPPV